jgi:hypothetical protein
MQTDKYIMAAEPLGGTVLLFQDAADAVVECWQKAVEQK